MADSKITALTALTTADPANDMIPIVDVSDTPPASGNTKRISINNILACSPTATFASLNVTGSSIPANGLYLPTTNTLEFAANSLAQYRIAPLGVFSWFDGAGGTRMTLNSTGLGLGVSPVTALSFPIGSTRVVSQSATTNHAAGNVGTLKFGISDGGGDYSGLHVVNSHNGTYSSQDLLFFTGEGGVSLSLERMRITRSGNLILSAPNTPPTLTTNGQLTVNATSNTNLRFSYRGSDGTTRVANITLA
jgi:hypothetical protein